MVSCADTSNMFGLLTRCPSSVVPLPPNSKANSIGQSQVMPMIMKRQLESEVVFVPFEEVPDEDILEIPSNSMGPVEEILMIGAGTSSSVPNVACLVRTSDDACKVCWDAAGRLQRTSEFQKQHGGPPRGWKGPTRNKRGNPSSLIRYRHSDGTLHSVLLDCGKTFYANIGRLLQLGVRMLDGVVITHGHADAAMGLDDLRHWTGRYPAIQESIDVYCDKDTMAYISQVFPYLVDVRAATGGGEVSVLKFHNFETNQPFIVGELPIQPIRVCHGTFADGRDYYANGFRIHGLAYYSDISGVPEESKELVYGGPPPELLVADCLLENKSYKSHYGWMEAAQMIRDVKPKGTILVGMSHRIDYYTFQRRLDREHGIIVDEDDGVVSKLKHTKGRVYVGFDGLLIRFIQ